MDFVELWIDGPSPVDRDDIEDALSDAFDGIGEMVGAGTCAEGGNLDLDVDPAVDRLEVLGRVFKVLSDLGVGDSVGVRPGDGEIWIRPSEWRVGHSEI